MKRSRVQRSTALASVLLLTLLLAPPAQAMSWEVAAKGWLFAADWAATVRAWLSGGAPTAAPAKPAGTTMRKTTATGNSGGGGGKVRANGDNGICLDPNGNRVTCPP